LWPMTALALDLSRCMAVVEPLAQTRSPLRCLQ
jgi:hypothetical protein